MGIACSECVARDRARSSADAEDAIQPPPQGPKVPKAPSDDLVAQVIGDGTRQLLHNNSGVDPTRDYEDTKTKTTSGGFGVVKIVKSKVTGARCALKSVKKSNAELPTLRNEVQINLCLDHPNVVRLLDVYEDPRQVYMVFEVCTGGEVLDAILEKEHFSECDALLVTGQLLWAVNYLHTKCIAHRDLKLENMLLRERDLPLFRNTVKLIDFGLATRFEPAKASMVTVAGSPCYVAPEVVSRRSKKEGYSEKCDIWGVGVILYMLLCGQPPFWGPTEKATLEDVRKGKPGFNEREWREVTEEAKALVRRMLAKNPRSRACVRESLKLWRAIPASAAEGDLAGAASPGKRNNQSRAFFARLREFGNRCHFEQAARYLIARHVSEDRVEHLRAAFRRMDTDGDGMLSLAEAKAGFQAAGIADLPGAVEGVFEHIDTDGSHQIDYTEFLAATMEKGSFSKAQVWEAFRVFDQDGDGSIDMNELRQGLAGHLAPQVGRLDSEQLENMLHKVDTNGDGRVDFNEFNKMLNASG